MKKIMLTLLTCFISLAVFGQEIAGQWNGVLKVQGTQLRLVFNITKTDTGYRSTMDSPDQGAKGIPVTSTTYAAPALKLEIANARISYEGTLGQDHIIVGNFKQGGQSFPMNLSREIIEKEQKVRPQEPVKPYPYYEEEVSFENKTAGITLAGTLTLPKHEGQYPAVILISGSGPQNRDEELMGHKPFLVIADYLTKNGIAVLRVDDRGIGASKGNFKTATTQDFATDVTAALSYLQTRKEINQKKIGLIGHSEGGEIAPMVASRSKEVAFIVLLAGPGIPGDQLLLLQQALIAKKAGVADGEIRKSQEQNRDVFNIVKNTHDPEQLKNNLTAYLGKLAGSDPKKPSGMSAEDYVALQIRTITSPWMVYFIKYDPAAALEKVTCPVLALNGEKDLQVPPEENLEAVQKALKKGGNKKVTAKKLAGLNHLFQECETGLPGEYEAIDQTFSPVALSEILNWIKIQTK